MGRTIFISLGRESCTEPYPREDGLLIHQSLNLIASMANRFRCPLVIRDNNPVIQAMLGAHFTSPGESLIIVPNDSTVEEIVSGYSPAAAFLVGGEDSVVNDAAALAANFPQIPLLPLYHTGGAAQLIADGLKTTNEEHFLLRSFGKESLGFSMISQTIALYGERRPVRAMQANTPTGP